MKCTRAPSKATVVSLSILERETILLLLSTGWFQEQIRA